MTEFSFFLSSLGLDCFYLKRTCISLWLALGCCRESDTEGSRCLGTHMCAQRAYPVGTGASVRP